MVVLINSPVDLKPLLFGDLVNVLASWQWQLKIIRGLHRDLRRKLNRLLDTSDNSLLRNISFLFSSGHIDLEILLVILNRDVLFLEGYLVLSCLTVHMSLLVRWRALGNANSWTNCRVLRLRSNFLRISSAIALIALTRLSFVKVILIHALLRRFNDNLLWSLVKLITANAACSSSPRISLVVSNRGVLLSIVHIIVDHFHHSFSNVVVPLLLVLIHDHSLIGDISVSCLLGEFVLRLHDFI